MIYVDNRQNKVEASEKLIEKLTEVIEFALKEEEVNMKCEISLLFVDNNEIKEINNETRGINRETDVLSFPMLEYEDKKVFKDMYKDYKFSQSDFDGDELVLGDIVLSLEKALEQSKEFNHSYEREASYLVVHSVLHLLGYDHMEDDDKIIMRSREEDILNKLNIIRG
ncbi:rRNA maturation RNase YbeY [Clostridium beijerinckii]|uniref:Endoribonuclease YbeY n=1 Tax=Clostridium beijerinckii TaxID=1520 RepID=A0A9Q5GN32_CLOBE|nr:rRNA maturation RNase YbeY [Clostridium beijerinckii]AQS03453.1 endoribonuclease YbeY [Clostridium beijerinckii]MBA2884707.1 putative rRNA maturation factor [Clostridium beijerinckii]MBA2899429.1 putative rRNA maturation factor [Clostridium beijerinckii]MBA2909058.1 putative rRNA maturation factor [Clostridium beijerinckii]MBA9017007.1 putative rRNA maturation factor [Clostridium beijerinckii]